LRTTEEYGNLTWYIYKQSEVNIVTKAYASIYTQQAIRIVDKPSDPNGLYIVNPATEKDFPGIKVDSIEEFDGRKLALMRIVGQ
jgi:hypothetical protein